MYSNKLHVKKRSLSQKFVTFRANILNYTMLGGDYCAALLKGYENNLCIDIHARRKRR